MQAKKKSMSSRLDRRIQLHRPVQVVNEYNEEQTVFEVAYSGIAASKKEATAENEDNKGNVLRGKAVIEWEIRFNPDLGINTTWKIKDQYDGKLYNIVSPVTEIGRREGLKIKTEIIE